RHHAGRPRSFFAAALVIAAFATDSNRSSSGGPHGANEKLAFSVIFVASSYHAARFLISPSDFSIDSLGSSSAICTLLLPWRSMSLFITARIGTPSSISRIGSSLRIRAPCHFTPSSTNASGDLRRCENDQLRRFALVVSPRYELSIGLKCSMRS